MTVPRRVAVSLLLLGSVCGCATLQQIAAFRQVAFALDRVQEGRLAGVPLSRIAAYQDLTTLEIGRIALAIARNDLPLAFRIDVRAENPADNRATATMVRLAWSLYLDDKETVHGVLDTSYALPAGQPVIIPLHITLNLRQFFDGPAETLVNLAAGVAGLRANPARIALRAVPSIDTPLGPIAYPSPITIVSRTVGGTSPP